MKQLTLKSILVVALALLMPFPDSSAEVFRCGNTFQDHPCEGVEEGKTVNGVGPAKKSQNAAASSGAAVYPECTRRGADSQKIVWARESGQLKEKLYAKAGSSAKKKLIEDVYRVRGTVAEVRTRIEAECHHELEERAKALAIHDAMVKAGVSPGAAPAPAGPSEAEKEAAKTRHTQKEEQRAVAKKKQTCDQLVASSETLRVRQRKGGSSGQMDRLRSESAAIDRKIGDLGCLAL